MVRATKQNGRGKKKNTVVGPNRLKLKSLSTDIHDRVWKSLILSLEITTSLEVFEYRLLFPTLSPRKAFTCRPLWCHHGPSSPQSEPPDHPADRLLPSTAHPSLPSLDPALSCHHTQHRSPLDSYVIYLWSDLPPDPKASITDSFDHSCIQQHLAYSWCQYMFVERETTDPMFAEAGMWTDPSQPSFASPSCMCMVLGGGL